MDNTDSMQDVTTRNSGLSASNAGLNAAINMLEAGHTRLFCQVKWY
jgi:hypothetical protein